MQVPEPPAGSRSGAPAPDAAPGGSSRFVAALLVVAVGSGLFAIAFRLSLAGIYRTFYHASNVVESIAALPWPLRLLVPVAGAAVAGTLKRLLVSRAQGVSNVMEAVALGRMGLSLRTTVGRVVASWSAIATGLSIGREGPLIEFGGSLGAAAGRRFGLETTRVRVLVAAGTAAGFASAYNTPFASVLFVLECLLGIAALDALLPMMAATAIATTLTRAIAGGGPIYGQRSFSSGEPVELVAYAIVGLLAALAALAFKRVLAGAEALAAAYPLEQPWRAAVGGLVVGSLAVMVPAVAGNGYEPLNLVLDQRVVGPALVTLMLVKMAGTSASVASGVPGGIFTPVLLVGGVVGSLCAPALAWAGLASPGHAGSYALVGMAATTAASIHAPLTAAVMVFELSGDYPIVLPLIVATFVATSVSRRLGSQSVYETELRDRGLAWELTLDGRVTVDARRAE